MRPQALVGVTAAMLSGVLLLGACGLAPDTFVGPVPEVQHSEVCTSNQSGSTCSPDARHADLRWAVGRVPYSVRLSVTDNDPEPSAFGEVDGTIELENPDACPATLQWTLTPEPEATRSPAPPLTPDAPESASLDDDPIPGDTREIRVDFRRLDGLPCWSQVLWSNASLD